MAMTFLEYCLGFSLLSFVLFLMYLVLFFARRDQPASSQDVEYVKDCIQEVHERIELVETKSKVAEEILRDITRK